MSLSLPQFEIPSHVLLASEDPLYRAKLIAAIKHKLGNVSVHVVDQLNRLEAELSTLHHGAMMVIADCDSTQCDVGAVAAPFSSATIDLPLLLVISSGDAKHVRSLVGRRVSCIVKRDKYLSVDTALEQIADGLTPMSPIVVTELAAAKTDRVVSLANSPTSPQLPECAQLTRREHQLIELLSQGLSFAKAANVMQVSVSTTQVHARNIYRKLGVNSALQAVSCAHKMGLLGAIEELS